MNKKSRIFVILFLVLLLPINSLAFGFFDSSIRPGAVKTNEYLPILKDKRVALIINQTSVVDGKSILDILLENKINVVRIFVPEHGFRGNEDAGAKIDNSIDSATGIKVASLYGKHKKPEAQDLQDIDVMVYDLQDVGARFYTYISTMEYCMVAATENKKMFLVFDRPNPNGFYVDGPVLTNENKSFVGMQPIPIVYGMTAGEYAQMLKGEGWFTNAKELNLKVITCENYNHNSKYLINVAPSPNLTRTSAIYAYPSLCLFEGTTISVGRGTPMPFMQFGSPALKDKFTYSFTPKSGKGAKKPMYEGRECFGVLVGDNEKIVLVTIDNHIHLEWLIDAYNANPDKEKFFTDFFTKLAGTSKLQEQINMGLSANAIRKSWKNDLQQFKKIRKKYLLYPDFK